MQNITKLLCECAQAKPNVNDSVQPPSSCVVHVSITHLYGANRWKNDKLLRNLDEPVAPAHSSSRSRKPAVMDIEALLERVENNFPFAGPSYPSSKSTDECLTCPCAGVVEPCLWDGSDKRLRSDCEEYDPSPTRIDGCRISGPSDLDVGSSSPGVSGALRERRLNVSRDHHLNRPLLDVPLLREGSRTSAEAGDAEREANKPRTFSIIDRLRLGVQPC